MSESVCPHEGSVTRATRTGQWSPSLQHHIDECEDCGDVVTVSRWMGSVAHHIEASDRPLPGPDIVWLRAQMEDRLGIERGRIMPDVVGRAVARAALGGLLAVAVLWVLPSIQDLLIIGESILRQVIRTSAADPAVYMSVPVLAAVALVLAYVMRPRRPGFFR